MDNYPKDLKYSKEHEWVRASGESATIGITFYAQDSLGDIVYVDLPKPGASFAANTPMATIESVKAASDVFAPVSLTVVEANPVLADAPETVNRDPYGAGWMVKVKLTNPAELDSLMDPVAYEAHVEAAGH